MLQMRRMLRLISLPRLHYLHPLSKLHPRSTFTTAAKVDVSDDAPPSRPRKRKRKSSASTSQWQGLSAYRLRTLRRYTRYSLQPRPSLYNAALDTLLISSLRSHPMHIVSPLITHVASLTRNNYQPSEHALLAILDAILSAASSRHLRFSPADIATESFFRITHAFNLRPTLPLLEAIAKHAATDPIVERRSHRIWSVLRAMRSFQLVPTSEFIFRCFETCIASLDVPAALTIMEYALSKRMYNDHLQPRIIDYYNAVMYAALLRGQSRVVIASRDELQRRKIPMDSRTEALLLATYIEISDPRAEQLRACLKRPLPDVVHAALIRAAAREKSVPRVMDAFQQFEEDLQESGRHLRETLSQPALTTLPAYGSLSQATSETARADPTMSTFQALRVCGAPEQALELLVRLKERYGYRPSRILYSTIIEAAWKTGKLELAQKLRVEMQSGATVGYTAPENHDVGTNFV